MPASGNTRAIGLRHPSASSLSASVAALLAAFVLGFAAPANADSQPFLPAQPARAFGDSVGVNAYLAWIDTAYGDFPTLQSRLRELGVRHIRDGLCSSCDYNVDRLNRLAADGIRANIIVGTLTGGDAQMNETLAGIRNKVRYAVTSVEPPNEPNLVGDPQWVQHAIEYQQRLYLRVKADPALANLTVLGPAVGYPATGEEFGDISPWLDRGNFHPYPGSGMPYEHLEVMRSQTAHGSGSKPLVATESGYHTDLATTAGNLPVSERAAAFYTPRLSLEGFYGGIERTYFFQLADPWPDAARPPGVSMAENRFGLLRTDLSRKPSFYALRNLLDQTDGDSAPVASPGGLHLSVSGAAPDLRQLLLRSADGSYALVLWRAVRAWDWANRVDAFPDANRVEVVLGDRIALARRFDPVASDAEQQRWDNPSRIPVDVAGSPVVLRLNPPGVASGGTGRRKAARGAGRCVSTLSAPKRKRCCRAARHRARGHRAKRRRAHPRRHRAKASWAATCVSVRRR